MRAGRYWYRLLVPTGFFTPKGLLARAAILAVAFLICHALGLREYTSIICGTSPTGNAADLFSTALGCVYLVLYFSFVLVVPIIVLGSLVIWGLERRIARPIA